MYEICLISEEEISIYNLQRKTKSIRRYKSFNYNYYIESLLRR